MPRRSVGLNSGNIGYAIRIEPQLQSVAASSDDIRSTYIPKKRFYALQPMVADGDGHACDGDETEVIECVEIANDFGESAVCVSFNDSTSDGRGENGTKHPPGKWAEATSLLDRMMDEGVHPNVLTFSSLIEVLCKEKKTEEAISLFELVIQRGTNPNIFAYNCLIHGFCNSSKWTEAASLLNKMMNEEVHPDVVTFNSLINALCKEKRTEEAITMWWTNESETCKTRLFHLPLFDTQGMRFSKQGTTEAAYEVLKLIDHKGVMPNGFTYRMIRMYCVHAK
ncbi:hypothetical protein F3Y22_tig00010533pilonHSYRG00020 [Hibiscus syriacus]|uniref:Pentatricopeptide repeat-containing protein n=1 Tax=Hibiscus syriacus TaxID=106335 RepID=A0A6A3C5Y7_HIBSY|nr:hypothetical protein F3Y22_tig00010533pilonHSYRG00020 [Hibiscus syriacus]